MAETNEFVQVPPNSIGEKIDHAGFSIAGETVVRQRLQVTVPTRIITASFSRPSNTTPYSIGDVVTDGGPTIITLEDAVREGAQSALLVGATLVVSSNPALKGDFRLFLFDTTVAMEADNAAWDPSDAEMATALGYIDFGDEPEAGGASGGTSNVIYQALGVNIPIVAPTDGVFDIFGILVVRNAYIPTASETFTVRLHVIQD